MYTRSTLVHLKSSHHLLHVTRSTLVVVRVRYSVSVATCTRSLARNTRLSPSPPGQRGSVHADCLRGADGLRTHAHRGSESSAHDVGAARPAGNTLRGRHRTPHALHTRPSKETRPTEKTMRMLGTCIHDVMRCLVSATRNNRE